MELKELIIAYNVQQKKHKLPGFDELNEAFEIEKIDRESQTLPRLVRKVMMEKIVNLMSLVELFLAPNNVPRMYLAYLKSMTSEERNGLSALYDKFSTLALECMSLEVTYSEKKEAEMINKIFQQWKASREELHSFFSKIQKPSVSNESRKEKSYFG